MPALSKKNKSRIVVKNKAGEYRAVNISPLTPPNRVFSIAWSILYPIIGATGALVWAATPVQGLRTIKGLYAMQLALNLSWPATFFKYKLLGWSLASLIVMDFAVAGIIYLARGNLNIVTLLMTPYLAWLLFATYLTWYIWSYN